MSLFHGFTGLMDFVLEVQEKNLKINKKIRINLKWNNFCRTFLFPSVSSAFPARREMSNPPIDNYFKTIFLSNCHLLP